MTPRARLTLFVAIIVVAATVPATTVGSSHFDVSLSPAIDTPDRTETFQGTSYTVTHLGRVDPGDAISVEVTVGSGTNYDVLLYDSNQRIDGRESGTGASSVSFDTANREPGSYVAALQVDGGIEDIEPVVVSQYRISVEAPAGATEGSDVDVEATLEDVTDDSPKDLEDVEVVVGDDDQIVRESLPHDSGDTYAGSVDVSSLSTGEYTLYVVARGTETIYGGQTELLGASDPRSFEVEAESSGGSGGGGSGGGGSGGDSGGGGDGGSATTATTTDTPDETTSGSSTATSDPGETTDGPTRTTTDEDAPEPATTDDSVITPNDPTTEPTTTSPGQPLGVLPVLLALLAVVEFARRRR